MNGELRSLLFAFAPNDCFLQLVGLGSPGGDRVEFVHRNVQRNPCIRGNGQQRDSIRGITLISRIGYAVPQPSRAQHVNLLPGRSCSTSRIEDHLFPLRSNASPDPACGGG